ncbi:MAG: hypothetical protein OEM00_04660 [Burkholderiaceae bacterium]|nr:hypothetical protein [Burkholderiaceae bacterium]
MQYSSPTIRAAWADDLQVNLEQKIQSIDRRIKEARTEDKGSATLAANAQAHKERRDLEA